MSQESQKKTGKKIFHLFLPGKTIPKDKVRLKKLKSKFLLQKL